MRVRRAPCRRCGKSEPDVAFTPKGSYCKPCTKAYNRAYAQTRTSRAARMPRRQAASMTLRERASHFTAATLERFDEIIAVSTEIVARYKHAHVALWEITAHWGFGR